MGDSAVKVYLEVGQRRAFACAVDWPGWCRAAKTEDGALQSLLDYGTRYALSLGASSIGFVVPRQVEELKIVERLEGNATTDFGAPGVIPEADRSDVSGDELDRLIAMLEASWSAFETAADAARGGPLRPAGPRGGGRELGKIREHVSGADAGYTNAVGGKVPGGEKAAWSDVQMAFVNAVRARARGEIPDRGPRGGVRWPARYAMRRSAWHALDHAWEIEDRQVTDGTQR